LCSYSLFREDGVRLTTLRDYEDFVRSQAKMKIDNIDYSTIGLCGEAGEVAEWVKKRIHRGNKKFTKAHLLKELGDVQHYLTRIALWADLTLFEVMQANIDKLEERVKNDRL
jgi:NTP pyrophosphatase (non-canonical NTP hydrolase)